MLDEIRELTMAILLNQKTLFSPDRGSVWAESLYCPFCGDVRRVVLKAEYFPFSGRYSGLIPKSSNPPLPRSVFPDEATYAQHCQEKLAGEIENAMDQLVPSLFALACAQCHTRFTAVIYAGPDGPALVILPSSKGGIKTQHTPEAVAYYLDQAQRAKMLGACTAAVAMFRAALESLLQHQGFVARMLGPKLAELEAAIAAKTAPQWAMELDTEFLSVIKELGNASIHTSDADISKQAEFDGKLVVEVNETFQMLLYLVYEVPHEKSERLDALRKKAQALKK